MGPRSGLGRPIEPPVGGVAVRGDPSRKQTVGSGRLKVAANLLHDGPRSVLVNKEAFLAAYPQFPIGEPFCSSHGFSLLGLFHIPTIGDARASVLNVSSLDFNPCITI